MVKYGIDFTQVKGIDWVVIGGIDWMKIATEVNSLRLAAISSGVSSSAAFNSAYHQTMIQHRAITGDAWKMGRKVVGKIMVEWKRLKNRALGEKKADRAVKKSLPKPVTRKPGEPVVVIEKSKDHIYLVLDGLFEVTFTKTDKGGVSATTRRLDRSPCLQSEVPFLVLKNARAVAQKHFHGDQQTGKLF